MKNKDVVRSVMRPLANDNTLTTPINANDDDTPTPSSCFHLRLHAPNNIPFPSLPPMPSLILTGHPCSLKTSFARLLSRRALLHPSGLLTNVVRLSDSDVSTPLPKTHAYRNSDNEKIVRAALKSAFERAVASDDGGSTTLVLLDSMNYIKGYRYELYCVSKAAGRRHGVVWITDGGGDALEVALERNRRRRRRREEKTMTLAAAGGDERGRIDEDDDDSDDDGYYQDDATVEELVLRFEPPDDRNRWEHPLYKVDMSKVLPWGKNGTLEQTHADENDDGSSVRPTPSLTAPEEKPAAAPPIKSAAGFKRNKKYVRPEAPPSTGTAPCAARVSSGTVTSMASRNLAVAAADMDAAHSADAQTDMTTIERVIDDILDSFLIHIRPLKEGLSTLAHASAESDLLNLVDAASTRVNNHILRAQKTASAGGGKIVVPIGERNNERVIVLKRSIAPPELRRVRNQYLKWMASHPPPDGTDEEAIAENYVGYIESHV
ncbi:hypothetical protein ACHAW6_008642 [Cyclotella cf. meneghiniana]